MAKNNKDIKIGNFLNSMLSPYMVELEYINRIKDGLETARNMYQIPLSDLKGNGTIIYMNGNDGTAFDWEMNNRLCEFGYLMKDSVCTFAFKMLIFRDGIAEIYCYPGGISKASGVLENKIFEPYEVEIFYESLCKNADDKRIWDADVREIYKL